VTGPCAECGQTVEEGAFHPYFYCILYKKLGITNQTDYLRAYGFVWDASVMEIRPSTAEAVLKSTNTQL